MFSILFPLVLFFHGVVHIIGTLAYWQIIVPVVDIVYKTIIIFGFIDLGDIEFRFFGMLFFFSIIVYILAIILFIIVQENYSFLFIIIVTIYSFIITTLGIIVAYAGVLINMIIFALLASQITFSSLK